MCVTYFFVIKCNRTGVTTVKKPTKLYAATASETLPNAVISLYKKGCDTIPIKLEVSENHWNVGSHI